MGPSPSDLPDLRPDAFPSSADPHTGLPVTAGRREPRLRYIVLFLLTLVTATLTGADHYLSFASEIGRLRIDFTLTQALVNGLWYSVSVLLILGAHEFGHYFACRYYRVNSSLPYFIPFWLPFGPTPGTLGAVIRIRQPIATKREFFDIGIAGPIAGFVVLIGVLIFAMSVSNVVELPEDFRGFEYGEPLLFQMVSWVFFGDIPPNHSINLHPTGWAAWFGMLATALNLAPVSQLDGGHISYAVFGRRSSAITIGVTLLMLGLLTVSMGYLLWTALLVVMVLTLGPHHPRTMDEAEPLDRTRIGFAIFAVAMFILCFTPVPVELIGF